MTKINPVIAQREILFVLAMLLALILFYLLRTNDVRIRTRPLGRRSSDLVKVTDAGVFLQNRNNEQDLEDLWIPLAVQQFPCKHPNELPRWRITLFDVARHNRSRYEKNEDGFFEFSHGPEEADLELAPLVRKILSKYRDNFEKVAPIHLRRKEHQAKMFTWVANEVAMRTAAFRFLDECLLLSRELSIVPSLQIDWDEAFVVRVKWAQGSQLSKLKELKKENPEVEFESGPDGKVTLSLWIAFTKEQIPPGLRVTKRQQTKMRSA
jgi:hypothetical protein